MKKEELFRIIKQKRLRLTKTRQAVLELFVSTPLPLSVADILEALACQSLWVNKTTIYRELEKLEAAGIIGSVKLQDERQHFELLAGDHHHHLVCVNCNKVEDVLLDESDVLRQGECLAERSGFSVLRHSLEFFGLCGECRGIGCVV